MADLTEETMTGAVTRAIQQRIVRLQRARNTEQLIGQAQALIRESDEPAGPQFLRLTVEAPTRAISSANMVEAWMVTDRYLYPAKAPALASGFSQFWRLCSRQGERREVPLQGSGRFLHRPRVNPSRTMMGPEGS